MSGPQGVGGLNPSSYQFMQSKGINAKDGVTRGELNKLDANADGKLNEPELAGLDPQDRSAVQSAFSEHGSAANEVVFPALDETHEPQEHGSEEHGAEAHDDHHEVTVGGVLGTHGVTAAVEHGGHHAIEHVAGHIATRAGEEAAVRAAEEATVHAVEEVAVRVVEHGAEEATVRAVEHGAGEAIAHGAAHMGGRIASVAAPGLGAAAAGYLAYQSIDHAVEAGKKGNVGASISYAAAGVVDATTAVVNAAGAVTGAGTLISTPVSIGLGVVATGFAALGAWLDD